MSLRKRNSFSSDFKAKVALEAIHGVKTLNEIALELFLNNFNTVLKAIRLAV
jgi:hypothetical protein